MAAFPTAEVSDAPRAAVAGISEMRPRTWRALTLAVVAVQFALHATVLAGRSFYWDDFIIVGRAARTPMWSPDFWAAPHDGHVAPLAFLLQAGVNRLAPWEWWIPVALMLVAQVAATLLLARAARALAGRTWTAWAAVAFAAFTPLTLPGSTWWSAAVNALPMHMALGAWTVLAARAVLDDDPRTRSPRTLWLAGAVLVLAVGFFEKSLAVMPLAAALTAAAAYVRGLAPVAAMRRGRPLWLVGGAITGVWAVIWLGLATRGIAETSGGGPRAELWWRGLESVGAGLLGGPWRWDRWAPSQAWAEPPAALAVAGGVVLAGLGVAAMARNRRAWAPALVGGAYLLVVLAAMTTARSGENTSGTLAQTLHYYGDAALVVALALAAMFPAHPAVPLDGGEDDAAEAATAGRGRAAPAIAAAVVVALLASSAWSAWTYRRAWEGDLTARWLPTVMEQLPEAAANPAPLIDQPVPFEVLLPVTNPANLYSSVLHDVRDRPEFGDVTPHPRMFDASGRIVDARVAALSHLGQGQVPQCGHEIRADGSGRAMADLPLSDLIFLGNHVMELNTIASSPMTVRLTFPNELSTPDQILAGGAVAEIPARPNQAWAAIDGGGRLLRVEILDAGPGSVLCLGAGAIGPLVPAAG